MPIVLHTATFAELAAVNARYADIGFLPSHAGELIVIATLDGKVAGQGRVVPVDARTGELGGIVVLPGYQGLGVARQIVEFLLRHTDFLQMYCLPFAELAGFYGSMGFVLLPDPAGTPAPIRQKYGWCNATYAKPVLLMLRSSN